MSATAVSVAFLSPRSALSAASPPRPPHPTRPTRNSSPGDAAEDLVPRIAGPATNPAAVAVEALRNARREVVPDRPEPSEELPAAVMVPVAVVLLDEVEL